MSRPERLRSSALLRDLAEEHFLRPQNFVLPIFLNSTNKSRDIQSMPGVRQWSIEDSMPFVEASLASGVKSLLLFGIVDAEAKDAGGHAASDEKGPVIQALQRYKKAFGSEILLWADTCLCEYTSHGHCGPFDFERNLRHHSDTLQELARAGLKYAQAGAGVIAPSAMADGMVGAIRKELDENGYPLLPVCSYSVKFASAFYGPFREAAENAPPAGSDRKSYQMNPANVKEALRESALDVAEGADLLMVKPGMPYLDVLRAVVERSPVPVGVYQVSGEYAMLQAAARNGWLDENKVFMESLLGFKRAGASYIISYWSDRAAKLLRG